MKFNLTLTRISLGILVIRAGLGVCLAQTLTTGTDSSMSSQPAPPSAADRQIAANDLAGKRGQEQMDLFSGSFEYAIPIACAPARNGSEPHLALAYSSGGENGWCGFGWKLDVGYIERNTKDGFPITYSTVSPAAPLNKYNDAKGFILNLFGKVYKLLPTATANEYRPEVDTEFLRCDLNTTTSQWTVYDKSGNVYYFGSSSSSQVVNNKTGWGTAGGYTAASATFHWALDTIDTATGDQTTITYQTLKDPNTLPEMEIYPAVITYNTHVNLNGYTGTFLGTHTITFTLDSRTDTRFSYRWGFRTEQNRRLKTILCQVGAQNVWRYDLAYVASPATARSLLQTVIANGFDANNKAQPLPTQTFTYQGAALSFGNTISWTGMNMDAPTGTVLEPEVTTVESADSGPGFSLADLVDIDGDGLPDRVCYDDTGTTTSGSKNTCKYQVQKNLGMQANGNGAFGTRYPFGPTSTSGGATASDANPIPNVIQYASLNGPYLRFQDINGDGLPDRVCNYWKADPLLEGNVMDYTCFEVMTNTGLGFAQPTKWSVSPGPTAAGNSWGFDIALYDQVDSGGVNVGFFDINGDGLPDRVTSMYYTEGAMINFRVRLNTGSDFTPLQLFGPYKSQNYNNYPISGQASPWWAGIETPYVHMVDINGDGLPDRVMLPMDPNHPGSPLQGTDHFVVEYNNGYGFEAVNTSTAVPGGADAWPGVNSQMTPKSGQNYNTIVNLPDVGLFDVNGDGLPDRVMLDETTYPTQGNKTWLVYLNNGTGFSNPPIKITNIDCQGQYSDRGWWGPESSFGGGNVAVTMMDINGDGLLDRVMSVYGENSAYFKVQLNNGPFPDLLTGINNGVGGGYAVTYKPSTAWDNRTDPAVPNSGSQMPFVRQTVASVTVSDGINGGQTSTYAYGGGFYDGSRREFSGFAVVTNTDPTLRYTVTYHHTGGGRNYADRGEYSDPGNFAKRGIPWRVESYGTDGLLYHAKFNQVDQVPFNQVSGVFRAFPFVSQTFDYDYPAGAGSTPRITGSKFTYNNFGASDVLTYNLTQTAEWGEVTGSTISLTSITTPTSVVQAANRYQQISYVAVTGNSDIKNHQQYVRLTSDAPGATVLKETAYTYNNNSGTVATKSTRICPAVGTITPIEYATTTYGNYTGYGLPGLITDPVGVVTEITYDTSYYMYPATTEIRVNPSADSTASDLITTTTYDVRSGALAKKTDMMGVFVQNTYDNFLRLTETDKTPYGGSPIWMIKASYNLGPITTPGTAVSYEDVQVNDGMGGEETRTYLDGLGRPIQSRTLAESGTGNMGVTGNNYYRVVSTAYDGRGNAFLTTWPRFENAIGYSLPPSPQPAKCIGYDAAGRVNQTWRRVDATFNTSGTYTGNSPDSGDPGSPLNAKGEQWAYVNGTDPWWKISTDEDKDVRNYQLDAFGRNVAIQEINGSSTYNTALTYDLANNRTQIQNNNSENIYYGYDNAGRLAAMADPYLGQWTYQRDLAGRLRVQTDARGDVITFSYLNPVGQQDALGRVQQKNVYPSLAAYNASTPASTATYYYDVNTVDNGTYPVYKGQLYMVKDGQGWEKNGYDTRGRLIITTRYLNINQQSYTTTYTYNDGDKVTSIGYPNSGPTINYTYFAGDSLNKVYSNAKTFFTATATDYDQYGHLTGFSYGNNLATTKSYYPNSERLESISSGSVFSRTYTYSAGDDICSLTGTGISGTATATYDGVHRLLTYSPLLKSSYSYDGVGTLQNNIENANPVFYYGRARKQAVQKVGNGLYLYDLCGNLIVRQGGLATAQALAYDGENQLTNIAQAGVQDVQFGYAADGARLWKQVNQDPARVSVWIGNIYEEKLDANKFKHTLFHVFAGSQQVCTFEAGSALNGGSTSGAIGYYYHEDNLTTTSVLTDSLGNSQEVDAYYPFGTTETATPQAAFPVSRRFTGQVLDAETGLYYYNARYYDPELGRFIQPDDEIPDFSNPQSYNRYSYVRNNPLRYTDPDGHFGLDANSGLTMDQQLITAHYAAPVVAGMGVGMLTGGAATPLLVGAGASTTFAAVGAGMLAGATGDLASQGTQIGMGQRQSISGQEVAVSSLAGGALLTVGMVLAPGAEAGNLSKVGEVANAGEKVDQAAAAVAKSPTITAQDLTGKSADEIRQLAQDKGLTPHSTRPDKWMDPATGKERLRLDQGHIDKTTGQPFNDPNAAVPHAHGYGPEGSKNPIVNPDNGNKHFPTTPSTPQNP
jgi:RHS repeat-associated protein